MKRKSSTVFILQGLIPYTRANMLLAFKPSAFFNELEKIDKENNFQAKTYRTSYYKAIKKGLIELDDKGIPRLTRKGSKAVLPFRAKKLKGAKLMVIFDIAEGDRWKRSHLRALLRELSFKQVQKSVWISEYDHRDLLKMEVEDLNLGKSVQIFESLPIK